MWTRSDSTLVTSPPRVARAAREHRRPVVIRSRGVFIARIILNPKAVGRPEASQNVRAKTI
jgi:hypothetical protein